MAERDDQVPFRLEVGYDQAELLGARWWHDGLRLPAPTFQRGQAANLDESRRSALKALVAAGGAVLVAGIVVSQCNRDDSSPPVVIEHDSLTLQREQGMAWQAADASFSWMGANVPTDADGKPFDPAVLKTLVDDLRPGLAAWQPFYVPTLFQAVTAPGSELLTKDFRMVRSAAMVSTQQRAAAIRELLELAMTPERWLLVVDLPGPESVAFAAGLRPVVCPVFAFDNWPHPRGVVPSHLTLGAVVHHRAQFVGGGPGVVPALVLDRNRLAPYANQDSRFDNRYAAKLPPANALRERSVERVLYVVPDAAAEQELDDLNARFVEYRNAGIEVRMLGLGDLRPAADTQAAGGSGSARYWWGGRPATHWWFWNHYGWPSRPTPGAAEAPTTRAFGGTWQPTPRQAGIARLGRTTETRGGTRGSSGSRSFGSGSWGRSSGGFGG